MADHNKPLDDTNEKAASLDSDLILPGGGIFEIRIRGQLYSHWSDYLGGLEVRLLEDGEMALVGPILDQAALMGVLNKLSYLNLTLLSVNKVNQKTTKEKK